MVLKKEKAALVGAKLKEIVLGVLRPAVMWGARHNNTMIPPWQISRLAGMASRLEFTGWTSKP